MPGNGILVTGARDTARWFEMKGTTINVRARDVTAHWAMILRTRIMAHASGRPGPNAPTGDYRRSWTIELVPNGNGWTAIIGTAKPQGRRLEFGFVGTDSLGRTYNQPPYPHVRPAAIETEQEFYLAIGRAI